MDEIVGELSIITFSQATNLSQPDVLIKALQTLKQQGVPDVSATLDLHQLRNCTPAAAQHVPVPESVGCYRVLEEIGCGGTGHVYKAEDVQLGRLVAVKVLKRDLIEQPTARQRFEREARAIAQLDCPEIVDIYEVDNGQQPYIVMEFVDGESLADTLLQTGPVPAEHAAHLLIPILSALDHAHQQGVIHRDVKPANILIDHQGRVKLADFGLARLNDQPVDLTSQSSLAGTPNYMSAEQVLDPANVDSRSDIYSVGVVFFQMLTGDVPFRGTTRAVLQQVVHSDAKSPRELNDSIPRDIENICLKALIREPSLRYQSAEEFRLDLLRWQRNEPVHARPLSFIGKSRRVIRRNPLVATTLCAVLILTAGLIGVWADFTFSLAESNQKLAASNVALQRTTARAAAGEASASANSRLADQQANLAFDLINELVFEVQDELAAESTIPEIRKAMLTRAIAGLDELATTIDDTSKPRASLVVALNRLGDVCRDMQQTDAAIQHYNHALRVAQKLTSEDSQPETHLQCLAWTNLNLGVAYLELKPELAKTHFHAAVREAAELTQSRSADTIRKEEALAVLLKASRQLSRLAVVSADSAMILRNAIRNCEEVIGSRHPSRNLGLSLAAVYNDLAEIERDNDRTLAKQLLQQAIATHQDIHQENAGSAAIARLQLNLAELELNDGNLSSARQFVLAAETSLTEISDTRLNLTTRARILAMNGHMAFEERQFKTARRHFMATVALLDGVTPSDKFSLQPRLSSQLNLAIIEGLEGNQDDRNQQLRELADRLEKLRSHCSPKDQQWLDEMLLQARELQNKYLPTH